MKGYCESGYLDAIVFDLMGKLWTNISLGIDSRKVMSYLQLLNVFQINTTTWSSC